MPGLDGIAAATAILRQNPAARIVLVTVHGDPMLVERGLEAGALGYVLKRTAGDELMPAVHSALRGERHVSRTPARHGTRVANILRGPMSVLNMPSSRSLPETELEQITQLAVSLSGQLTRVSLRRASPRRSPRRCSSRRGDPRRRLPAHRVQRVGRGRAGRTSHADRRNTRRTSEPRAAPTTGSSRAWRAAKWWPSRSRRIFRGGDVLRQQAAPDRRAVRSWACRRRSPGGWSARW